MDSPQGEPSPADGGPRAASDDGGSTPDSRLTTAGVLGGARRRLEADPAAALALVLAGGAVAVLDLIGRASPVPTDAYAGIGQFEVSINLTPAVTVISGETVSLAGLVAVDPAWAAAGAGLALLEVAVVTAAAVPALGRLLDVDPSPAAAVRYGLLVAVLRYGFFEVNFSGLAVVVGVPLLVAYFFVIVRLVPLAGRLVLGEDFATAAGRSWASARGHGWALIGVVAILGFTNHVLASIPLVGVVGSGAIAAIHAGVVAEVVERLPVGAERGRAPVPEAGPATDEGE
ncbi:MAG: hypothetical protein V5A23_00540 [Halobacteriales archaeon]